MEQETTVISKSSCGNRRMAVIHLDDGKGLQSFTRHQHCVDGKWMMNKRSRTVTKRTHGSKDFVHA